MYQPRSQPPQRYTTTMPTPAIIVTPVQDEQLRPALEMPPTPRLRTIPLPSVSNPLPTIAITSLLAYRAHRAPRILFNAQYSHAHAQLGHHGAALTMDIRRSLATAAPVPTLRLRSDSLPWSIEVREVSRGAGVRVDDVLGDISRLLFLPAGADDMAMLDVRTKAQVDDAFRARVKHSGRAAERAGVLRIDWLRGRTMFLGLVPTADPHTFTIVFGLPA